MILVTVGTSSWDFSRLVEEVDLIAVHLQEEIIMQIGNNKYQPINTRFFRFATKEVMDELFKEANIIICHDGAGSIINSLVNKKITIVVPRMQKYGEVGYNSKADLALELEKSGKIILIWDVKDILNTIQNIKNVEVIVPNKKLLTKLKEYIDTI